MHSEEKDAESFEKALMEFVGIKKDQKAHRWNF